MKFLFILMTSCLGVYVQAVSLDEGQVINIANSVKWQRLLHSEEKADFLVEARGNRDQFLTEVDYACRFPARAAFLSKTLKITYKKCPAVEEWKALIGAKKVSLVYVTQYVSNPSSVFGHSFLLFQNNERPLNLDVVFNNAANVPENVSTYDYVVKGMFGGFPAIYTKEPFYLKIQEYNNIENRDLWLYQLKLSSEEIEQLLNHLWELDQLKDKQYYFLNKNCAYNIYNAVAAVQPSIDFIEDPKLYVLPVDTLKKMNHLSDQVLYFPSIRQKLIQRYRKLDKDNPSAIDQAEIQLELYEYKKSQNGGKLSDEELKNYNLALLERSKLGRREKPFEYDMPEVPDRAHPTWNLSITFGADEVDNYGLIGFAPFHHSLLQPETGYLPNSEIIVLETSLKQVKNEALYLNEITFIKVSNFVETSHFDSQYSWQFEVKETRDSESGFYLNGFADLGKSKTYFNKELFYILGGLSFDKTQSLVPEAKIGVLYGKNKFKLQLQAEREQNLKDKHLSKDIFELAMNYQLKNEYDIEVSSNLINQDVSHEIRLNYNF